MKSKNEKSFLGKKHAIRVKIKKLNNLSKTKKLYSIKGPWTYHEDLLLKKWVDINGPKNWRLCAKNIPGRNQSQCRQHWNNKLKPNLLIGNWSSEEIFLIVVFYKKYNGSWKKIIPIFKSRTENSIKNIFFSQTRAIVSKIINEKDINKKILDLPTLLKYYDIVYDETKKKFLEDNPISENDLEEYIKNIEILLEKNSKGKKYIDLNFLRQKYKIKIYKELDDESSKDKNEIDKKIIKKTTENNNEIITKTEEIESKSNKEDVSNKEKEVKDIFENNKINNVAHDQINDKNSMGNLINNIFNIQNNNNNFNQINNTNNGLNSILNYYLNYYNIINRLLLEINYNLYNYNIINGLLSNRNNNINYNNLLNSLIANTNNNMNSNNNINNSFPLNNNNEINNKIIDNINNINQINKDNINNSSTKKQVDFSEHLKNNGEELSKNIEEKK